MNPYLKKMNHPNLPLASDSSSQEMFSLFLRSIEEHLKLANKDALCLETSKHRYNLPPYVKIYDLEEAREDYPKFLSRKISTNNNLKWQIDETNLLVFIALYHQELKSADVESFDESDWEFISKLLNRSSDQCESRWISLMKSRSNKKSWTLEEDEMLTNIIKSNLKKGSHLSWVKISQELFEKSDRTIIKMARRCRERWINYLDPTLKKGSWSQQEDLKLLEQFIKLNKKWTNISESLEGRNLNSVKNRFHSLIKKHMISEPSNDNIEALIRKIKNIKKVKYHSNESEEELKIEDSPKKKVKMEALPKKIEPTPNPIIFPFIHPSYQQFPMVNPFNVPFGMPNALMRLPVSPFEQFNGMMSRGGFMTQFMMNNPFLMFEQFKRENSSI